MEGILFINAGPAEFERHLHEVVFSVQGQLYDERLVFLNAWNEWPEGNYLEPDLVHGLARLEAVHRTIVPISAAPRVG